MDEVVGVAIAAIEKHPAVEGVEFAGSRSRATHHELSDWDFAVKTWDFPSVARDLPRLTGQLKPLAAQWEPLGHFPVYQVMLRGPTKVEYLFLDQTQNPKPPVRPSRGTLGAIDTHFWDWIWWIATKYAAGRDDLMAEHLPQLYRHLLQPMGVDEVPTGIRAAIESYVLRREALESECAISVSRALENEVRPAITRIVGTE